MKHTLLLAGILSAALIVSQCKSGLVTMSNGCYNLISSGEAHNKSGNYTAALEEFNQVLKKCDAYDAKEKAFAGKASALNGLKQYSDALDAANQGLRIDKTSIDNLLEKAIAELGLGMPGEAKTDLGAITDLTSKNQHVAQRATIYAKLAEVNTRLHNYDQALHNIEQAISLDNGNLNFYIQWGDINAEAGNFSAAIDNYNEAIAKGKNDAEAWKAKTAAMVKMYQKKYNTDNAGILAKKMNASEKSTLCTTIQTSQEKGVKDMAIDLMQVAACK